MASCYFSSIVKSMLLYLKILRTFLCSADLYLPFTMGRSFPPCLSSWFCYGPSYFNFIDIHSDSFSFLLWEPFFLRGRWYNWLVLIATNFKITRLGKQLRMGNGEIVSMNPIIYFNPHGEIGKTSLINWDMVKAQLDISFSTTWIYSPVLPDSSHFLM